MKRGVLTSQQARSLNLVAFVSNIVALVALIITAALSFANPVYASPPIDTSIKSNMILLAQNGVNQPCTTIRDVFVREFPDPTSSTVGDLLKKGTEVTVTDAGFPVTTDKKLRWFQIENPKGYIYSSFLQGNCSSVNPPEKLLDTYTSSFYRKLNIPVEKVAIGSLAKRGIKQNPGDKDNLDELLSDQSISLSKVPPINPAI